MLIVKIELHSAVDGHIEELGRTYIANDGTGTVDKGNYNVAVCRKGNIGIPETLGGVESAARTGRVQNYSRNSYNVWRLIARALLSAFPEEQKTNPGKTQAVISSNIMAGLQELSGIVKENIPDAEDGDLSINSLAALRWINAAVDNSEQE